MLITVNVQQAKEPPPAREAFITLHPSVLQKYRIAAGTALRLCYGSRKAEVRVYAGHHHPRLLQITQSAARQLLLEDGTLVHINYHSSQKELFVGPLFAILLDGIKPEGVQPFGILSDYCREVMVAARKRGIVPFVMAPERIHLSDQSVTGWTWRSGSWQEHSYPLPNVVYNRLSRSRESDPQVQEVLSSAQRASGWQVFNTSFLNKWQVYQQLQPQPPCRMPATELFRDGEQLKKWVRTHAVVFLKPVNGSLGKGIYRIQRDARGFQCASSSYGSARRRFATADALYRHLEQRIQAQPYLIQKGIPVAKMDGHPVDFRVLVQRGAQGKWLTTSSVARQAHPLTFVSNLARGGQLFPPAEALRKIGFSSPQSKLRDLRMTALKIASLLSQQPETIYAEFGVDLAIDVHGVIWLLEVNSKPSKNEETLPVRSGLRPSTKNMLAYVAYLWRKSR